LGFFETTFSHDSMPMSDMRTTDLTAAGLVRVGSRIQHFGDPTSEASAALNGNAVFDLQHLALIAVHGDDAEEFLQGQLTNDLRGVTATRAQLSAWCSPRGRVLTCLLVFRHDAHLLLQLPDSLLEPTLKRLRMFVLRAKARLEDASTSWMRMGLVGEDAESRLRELCGAVAEKPDDVCSLGGITIIRLRGRRPRYEIVGTGEALTPVWNACREVAAVAGADAWELLDIEAGVAVVGPDTSDTFVPQMINLDRIGGLSFTKGCYVGQEIVARTQHLGRIKRRMYRAYWNGNAPIDPGDTLESSVDPASPKAQVVNAKAAPGGGFHMLAVMPIDVAANFADGGLTLSDGSQLTLQELPYALEGGLD
jgi:folate-binding protein YgfZ